MCSLHSVRREGFITFPKTVNFSRRYLRSHKEMKASMPDSIFRHENRRLLHGSNFSPSPFIMTKLLNCEEQRSLPPSQPVRGKRWWGPMSNTWSHIVHSHDHPITEWCNPNYSPTQRFYISPHMHWGANLKDQENRNWGHYVPAYRQIERPTNQHICRQFCQQHADCLCQQAFPVSYGNGRTTFKMFATQPHCMSFLMMCILCTVDNQFAKLNQHNTPCSSIDIYVIL